MAGPASGRMTTLNNRLGVISTIIFQLKPGDQAEAPVLALPTGYYKDLVGCL
jgi:hypothetical protein